jgi:hypothetical protein
MLQIYYNQAFPDLFNHLLVLVILALLGISWRISRARMFLFWAAALKLVILGDAFLLHERLGDLLVHHGWVGALPGLRADDTGELLVWSGLALPLVGLLLWALRDNLEWNRNHAT